MLPHFYESVPGWFAFKKQYEDVAAKAESGDVIVELGSFHGRSAAFLAVELANRNKKCRFVCVDTFCGSTTAPQSEPDQQLYASLRATSPSWLPEFKAQMERGGVLAQLEILVEDSASAARHFADGSVRYVLVDAAHDYRSVRQDLGAWMPKLSPGGLLMGDDYLWPGVTIAAREMLPLSQIEEWHGNTFRYINAQREIGTWRGSLPERCDTVCFLPYVNGVELLQKAVGSIRELWASTIVFDQSASGLGEPEWLAGVAAVVRTPPKANTFSQVMNWARYEAHAHGADTLFFMHHDAQVLRPGLIAEMRALLRQDARCGAVQSNYDAFEALRVEALIDTGAWDESFPWYFSDIDYYRRMKLRGWKLIEHGKADVTHYTSATLKNDPAVLAEVQATDAWLRDHYKHKWGGLCPNEKYVIPYNGQL